MLGYEIHIWLIIVWNNTNCVACFEVKIDILKITKKNELHKKEHKFKKLSNSINTWKTQVKPFMRGRKGDFFVV